MTPGFEPVLLVKSQAQVFPMWRWRDSRADSYARSNVRTVDTGSHSKPEGNIRTAFENPIGDAPFTGIDNSVWLSDFVYRLLIAVRADAAVPVDARIYFWACRATLDEQRQNQRWQPPPPVEGARLKARRNTAVHSPIINYRDKAS